MSTLIKNVHYFLTKNKVAVILIILIGIISSVYTFLQKDESSVIQQKGTLNINDSKGVTFKDSIIQGGTNLNETENINFNKTRISE